MTTLVRANRLTALDRAALTRLCGPGAVERGTGYQRTGKVVEVVASGDGRRLHASVTGSGGRRYACWAELVDHPARPGHSRWASHCACPVAVDCKHVVAAILEATARETAAAAARDALGAGDGHWWRGMPPAVHPDWRSALGAVGLDDDTDQVALQLSHATTGARRRRDATPPGAWHMQLTPLVRGARGWIRTGISWAGLDPASMHGTVRASIDPLQESALQELPRAVRARRTNRSYGPIERINLDDLGPHVVPLLRAVIQSGVALIDVDEQPVHVLDRTGRFELQLSREGGDMVLTPVIALPDELDGVDAEPIGLPAAAMAAQTDDGLVIVGLDPPLSRVEEGLLRERPLRVPEDEWPAFVLQELPALRRRVRVVLDPAAEIDVATHAGPRLLVQLTPLPDHVTEVELGWRYAVSGQHVDAWPLLPDTLGRGGAARYRDLDAEDAVLSRHTAALDPILSEGRHDPTSHRTTRVGNRWPWQRRVVLDPTGTIALSQWLTTVADDPDVIVEETSALPTYVEASEAPVIDLGIDEEGFDDDALRSAHDRGGPSTARTRTTDWFDLEVSVTVDGQDVPVRDLIVALRSGQQVLVLSSGTWLRLDDPRLRALAELLVEAASLRDDASETLRLTPFHVGLWDELVDLGVVGRQSSRWRQTVDALLGLDDTTRPVPEGLRATLRPYQHDGYQWLSLLWEARLGGILADDMGLGKTMQTLAMALRAKESGDLTDPLLIVAPTSVVGAWVEEAARWTPDLVVRPLAQTMRKAGTTLPAAIEGADVVVTSYALVRIDEDSYLSRRWGGVVLDEAQFVKNHQAKTYQVVRRLDAGMKLAITGTPLENSLMDLWSLLSITAPGLYPRPREFRDAYVKPIEAGDGADQLATLRRRIRPLMMRRTKEQVATELPPKIEQIVHVPLGAKHRTVYDRYLQRERQRLLGLLDADFTRNRVAILRALTALRQLSLHPSLVDPDVGDVGSSAKIDLLVEHLRELAAEGHRALVFSTFTGYLALVRERLTAEGIDYCYLDGRTRRRAERIQEFRDGTQPAFLISLKAGGFGLTLTEADYVYVLDPWWNPAAEAQAIDRTHRIGQDKPVNVYRFVSEDTIEDKVVALQQRKRDLFAQVVDEGEALAGAVTADDIRGLLG